MLKKTLILLPATLLLLVVGCSKIDGTATGNLVPTVAFVNNVVDADSSVQAFSIPDYGFIFEDYTKGFEEDENGRLPDSTETDVEARFELIRFQYFGLTEIHGIVETYNGAVTTVPAACYRVDPNIPRYVWVQNTAGFHWKTGAIYEIDGEFEYRPVHSFAPLVFWRGNDPDGFVEGYRFYDYTYVDDTDLAAFHQRVVNDDPALVWTYTRNTQATVNLRTTLGRIQKHVIYVQAIDNDDQVSAPARRVFNRSNRAPNTPKISFYKDGYSRNSQPDDYVRHIIDWSDVELALYIDDLESQVSAYYEVPMSAEPLVNWGGMRFLVNGDDPDDQALVTIPLQYQFVLHRIPADQVEGLGLLDATTALNDAGTGIDTLAGVERVVLSDENVIDYENYGFLEGDWTDQSQIEFYNLATGFYQLTVYSRDDGYESCVEPAWMRFRTQQVTMERDVLVLDFTPQTEGEEVKTGFLSYQDRIDWYRTRIEEALPQVWSVNGLPDSTVVWMDQVAGDDYNCRWWRPEECAECYPYLLPFSVMSQYRTVICLDDKWASGSGGGTLFNPRIANPFKGLAMDYLDMGGSLFWSGYSSIFGTFGYSPSNPFTSGEDQIIANAGDFLRQYLGIDVVYGDDVTTYSTSRGDAFTGAQPAFTGYESLQIDTERLDVLKQDDAYYTRFASSLPPDAPQSQVYARTAPDTSLVYVEALGINEGIGATAFYTYDSFSADLPERETFDFFRVARANTPGVAQAAALYTDRPAAPTETGCWLYIIAGGQQGARNYSNMTIFNAYSARNLSREDSMWADPTRPLKLTVNASEQVFIYVEHQRIANPEEYWAYNDVVAVDVQWDPILVKHRKPIIVFTENQSYEAVFGGFGANPYFTNFRTAFSCVPLSHFELGTAPDWVADDYGSGAKGLLSGILNGFYAVKLQDRSE